MNNYCKILIVLIMFFAALTAEQYSQFLKPDLNKPVIPDVMGYINVLETDGKK